jgi:CBS domain containing-hemolysin-like protein
MLGYFDVKDFFANQNKPDFNRRTILREPVYVPENLYAIDVLKQFKSSAAISGSRSTSLARS